MPQSKSAATATGSLILIALIVGGAAAAFAYTAGWFCPGRLTANRMVDAFTPPGGPPLGHRRNHAKGICFTGVFESNGTGTALSRAQIFAPGEYPALGRLNLATTDPNAADASARVRGMGLQISASNGEEWRTAMIDAPVFAVSTPQAFYQLLLASKSKDPNAMPTFAAGHPEFAG
ncbi:MAG TPA: catalase, partial [Steroidobacteraceae bacterium]